MYSGSDLTTLMSALDTLAADNFFQYDFNVGTKTPYLMVSISNTQIVLFPAIAILSTIAPLMSVYYTTDFSPPVSDFITAIQAACHAYAVAKSPVWQAYYDHAVTFQNFLNLLATK